MYVTYPLSLRNVEDLLAERGIDISHETVTLEDKSPAFDPRTMQMPEAEDLARPLEERRIGGLGIFLAFQGVDRFEPPREGQQCQCLRSQDPPWLT